MAQAEVAASALASAALASALAAADEAEKERAGEQEMPLFLAGDQLQQSRMRFVLRRWRWNITNRPLPSTALLTAQGRRMFWESLSARPLRRVLTYWHCESERRFASAQLLRGAEAVRICSVLIRWREGAHNHALQLLGAYFGDIYADRVGARLRAIRQWQAFALVAARLKVAAFANATRSFRRSWVHWLEIGEAWQSWRPLSQRAAERARACCSRRGWRAWLAFLDRRGESRREDRRLMRRLSKLRPIAPTASHRLGRTRLANAFHQLWIGVQQQQQQRRRWRRREQQQRQQGRGEANASTQPSAGSSLSHGSAGGGSTSALMACSTGASAFCPDLGLSYLALADPRDALACVGASGAAFAGPFESSISYSLQQPYQLEPPRVPSTLGEPPHPTPPQQQLPFQLPAHSVLLPRSTLASTHAMSDEPPPGGLAPMVARLLPARSVLDSAEADVMDAHSSVVPTAPIRMPVGSARSAATPGFPALPLEPPRAALWSAGATDLGSSRDAYASSSISNPSGPSARRRQVKSSRRDVVKSVSDPSGPSITSSSFMLLVASQYYRYFSLMTALDVWRALRRAQLPQRGETLDDESPWLLEAANMEPSIGHASLAIACLDSTADSCEAPASLSSDANAGRALQPNLEVLSAPAELSYQTSVAMTVGGTVAAFDQIMFTACLARVLNIAASQIALEIWSGSVHVKSTIASRTPHAAAAVVTTLEAHTPDSLSASLAAAASLLNFGGAEDASAAADGTSGADGAHGGGGMFDVLELGPPAPVVEFMPAANCLTDQGATPRAASDGSGEGRDGLSTARTALDGDIDTATPEVSSDRWVHSRLAAGASGNYSPPNLALWTGDTTAAAADAEAVMSIALAHRAAGRSSTCDDKTVSAPASPTVECRHPPDGGPRTVTTLAAVPAAAIPTLVTTAHGDSAHDYGSDSGGDGGSSCARIGSSYDGGGATWTCTVSEGDAPTCAAVAGLGHTLQPPPAALPYSAEIRSLQEETVLTQPSVPQQPRCEAGGTSGSGTCGATSDDGPDALYSPPPRVRQALGGPPPMARGVAVSAVPAPPLVSSTAHPVAVAALSAPGVQIVQLTERPDGATQLIIVLGRATELPPATPPQRPMDAPFSSFLSAVTEPTSRHSTFDGSRSEDGQD